MFLRRYVRTKAGKKHAYFALVESVRTDAGPRQHVVAYLGELNADQERRWQRTVVFHNRQGDEQPVCLFPDDDTVPSPDDPDVVRVRVKEIGWTNARRFGDVYLAGWLWNLLDLDAIIHRHVARAGKPFVLPTSSPSKSSTVCCAPCSEFALAEHWYASTVSRTCSAYPTPPSPDRLYRTLDRLLKAGERPEGTFRKRGWPRAG